MVLNPEILTILKRKTGKKEKTIRNEISLLRRRYSSLPINAIAQIYAIEKGTSVLKKLTSAERKVIPNLGVEKAVKITQKPSITLKKNWIKTFIRYDTSDPFIAAHIDEVNKCYTCGCYIAAFILCRKIIENLLTDIIRSKYPSNRLENIQLYFDTSKGRTKDFSEIISNLKNRAIEFGPDKKLLEKILLESERFRDDANDKTHSWYHLVNRSKLESTEVHLILQMLRKLGENIKSSL